MAGPDTKLSQKIPGAITDPTGGYLHIIVPDGGGGWDSKAIAVANIMSAQLFDVTKDVNKSSDYPIAFDAGTKLFSIDIQHLSGNPLIKVGTTSGGDEISLSQIPIPSGEVITLDGRTFDINTTVYISISGGSVNINYLFIENYF